MSRPLRVEFTGALYHVTSRGNARQAIYLDEQDFQIFVEVLADTCQRFNWVVHSYCLMTNHYHILLETPDGNLSKWRVNGVRSCLLPFWDCGWFSLGVWCGVFRERK